MPKAVWRNVTLAESDDTVVVEGNHYFPPGAVNWAYLRESNTQSVCVWKGRASYYDIEVDGLRNQDAAWTYRRPSEAAGHIRDYVAFWKGVKVQ